MSDTTLPKPDLADWHAVNTAALAAVNTELDRQDREAFEEDIAYLNGLADFMLETVGHRLTQPADTSIEEQVLDDTPYGARRNMFALYNQPTFAQMWASA